MKFPKTIGFQNNEEIDEILSYLIDKLGIKYNRVSDLMVKILKKTKELAEKPATYIPPSDTPQVITTVIAPPSQEEPTTNRLAREIFIKAMSGEEPFKGLPCPYDVRKLDQYLQCFFCARNLNPPFNERRVRYAQIYSLDQCVQCIEVSEAQKRLKAIERSERQSETPAKVNWNPNGSSGYFELNRY